MIESSKLLIDKSQTEKHLFPLLIGGTSPMLGARRKPEVITECNYFHPLSIQHF